MPKTWVLGTCSSLDEYKFNNVFHSYFAIFLFCCTIYLKIFQRFFWYIVYRLEHTEDIEELWKLKKNKAKDLTKNEEIPFFKVFPSN